MRNLKLLSIIMSKKIVRPIWLVNKEERKERKEASKQNFVPILSNSEDETDCLSACSNILWFCHTQSKLQIPPRSGSLRLDTAHKLQLHNNLHTEISGRPILSYRLDTGISGKLPHNKENGKSDVPCVTAKSVCSLLTWALLKLRCFFFRVWRDRVSLCVYVWVL